MPFTLAEARRTAARVGGLREVQHNEASRVVAFLTRDDIRINVWFTTGTVGTYLDHPRMGKTQLFRRGVGLDLLEKIFRNPRIHTNAGYHFASQQSPSSSRFVASSPSLTTRPGPRPAAASSSANPRERSPRRAVMDTLVHLTRQEGTMDEVDEEAAAKAQRQRLLEEKKKIDAEIRQVEDVLGEFEKKREEERRRKEEQEKKKAEEEKRKVEQERRRKEEEEWQRQQAALEKQRAARGTSFRWSLDDSDFFKKNLAVGGSYVFGCWWLSGIGDL